MRPPGEQSALRALEPTAIVYLSHCGSAVHHVRNASIHLNIPATATTDSLAVYQKGLLKILWTSLSKFAEDVRFHVSSMTVLGMRTHAS